MNRINIEVQSTKAIMWSTNNRMELRLKYIDYTGVIKRGVNHKCYEYNNYMLHVFYNNDDSINKLILYRIDIKGDLQHVLDIIYKKGNIWKKIEYLTMYYYSKIIYIYKDNKLHNVEFYDINGKISERKYYNYDKNIVRHYFYDANGNNMGNIIESIDELDVNV